MPPETQKRYGPMAWVEKNKFGVQSAALIAAISASIGLLGALSAGQEALSVLLFVVVALSLGITMGVS